MVAIFDALGLAEDWEKAGLEPDQARKLAAALRDRMQDGAVTKGDLLDAERRLELKIKDVEIKIDASARALVMWLAGILVAQAAAIVALMKLLP